MLCREYFYKQDELKSWDKGKICVGDWIQDFCEDGRAEFTLINNNYEFTKFDYSFIQRCRSMEDEYAEAHSMIEDIYSGAQTLAACFMAALATLAILN